MNTSGDGKDKGITKNAENGSLTKLEGGLDADDTFYVFLRANGYYTGAAKEKEENGCKISSVDYPTGKYPDGYKLTIIDDVIEVHAVTENGIRISPFYRLTEDDYELNKTTAPYVQYNWYTGLDFSTGQGATSVSKVSPDAPFTLYAKTSVDGDWEFVQVAYDTNQTGRVEFPEAVGKGYVAYKVESPDLHGNTTMYLYNIAVTYKADSELLQSMAQKSDMTLSDYIPRLRIDNVAAFRIDKIVENADGTKSYELANPRTSYHSYMFDENFLNVEQYVHEDDKGLERDYREDYLNRAKGYAETSKFMRHKIDPSTKTVSLMNRLMVYQSYDGKVGEYGEDVDEKNALREVVFYDLLPEGYSFDRDKPIYAYTNFDSGKLSTSTGYSYTEDKVAYNTIPGGTDIVEAEVTEIEIVEDYQGSGRQMVIFHVKAPDDVSNWVYRIYNSNNYHDSAFCLTFYASGAYGDVNNGTPTHNVMSVQKEDGTNFIASGQPSNSKIYSDSTLYQEDGISRVDYTDVNKQGTANTMYSNAVVTPIYLSSYEAGIKKSVKGYSGKWSLQDQVLLDNDYRYRIQYGTTSGSTKNIIIYDILETAINSDGATGEPGMWQGTYVSSNLKSLRQRGIDVKVWYSVESGLKYDDFEDTEYLPEDHTEVWTDVEPEDKSTIKAVAYDLRYMSDGSEFVLQPYDTLSLEIVMHAPEDLQDYHWAYNLVAYNSTFIDTAGNVMSSFNQSNRVKVELNKYCELSFEKYYNDTNGEVRIPLANTTFSLYKCSEDEDGHTHTGLPGDSNSCWKYFQKVITDENGDASFTRLLNGVYAIVETGTPAGFDTPNAYWTFTVDSTMGTVTDPDTNELVENSASTINFERLDDGTFAIVNERDKTEIQVEKKWVAPTDEIPDSLVVNLYQDGELFASHTLTADEDWSYTFANLYKYSLVDGHEFEYTVEEESVEYFEVDIKEEKLKATGNIRIIFDENSKVADTYDCLYIYYKPEGSNYYSYVRRTGTSAFEPIILPAVDDYYFYWYSDGRNADWGFEIADVQRTDEDITPASSSGITSPSGFTFVNNKVEVDDISEIKTEHSYSHLDRIMWHITGLGGPGKKYTFTNTRLAQLEVHKEVPYLDDGSSFNFETVFTVQETVDGNVTDVPVTKTLTVHKYASEDADTYETLTLTPDENGKVTYTLANGEWLRFIDLPVGTKYKTTEEDTSTYQEQLYPVDENNELISNDSYGVYLKLDPQSTTEGASYDYFSIYYRVDDQLYVLRNPTPDYRYPYRFGGTSANTGAQLTNGIYVPTTDFYIGWRTDYSGIRYGFEFIEVSTVLREGSLAEEATKYGVEQTSIDTIFGSNIIETNDIIADVKTAHTYSNNERKLWHVTVAHAGANEIENTISSANIERIKAINQKYAVLSFTKVDNSEESQNVLSGVTFALYKCKNTDEEHTHSTDVTAVDSCYKYVKNVTSDDSGNVSIADLLNGDYVLKETNTLTGYVLPEGYWSFSVTNGVLGTITKHVASEDDTILDFTANEDGSYELENVRETVEVSAEKNWDSATSSIPASLTVNLLRNGEQYRSYDLTAAEDWKHVFENLFKYDTDGNEYTYTIEEVSPNGFTSTSAMQESMNVRIQFNAESRTYNSSDNLYIYCKPEGQDYYSIINKTYTNWSDVVVPYAEEYYFYWTTNNTSTAYGFEIENISLTTDEVTTRTGLNYSIPNYTVIEAVKYSDIKTDHNYANNERILWHYVNPFNDMKGYTFNNTRLGTFDVHKEVRNSDTTDDFLFTVTFTTKGTSGNTIPYTESVTYQKYASKDATEYSTETATPDVDGKVTFNLKDDEWVRFVNLPIGLEYTVNEQPGSPYNVVIREDAIFTDGDMSNKGVYLKLNPNSQTESFNYDYLSIYYKVGDQWYVVYNNKSNIEKSITNIGAWRFGGTGAWMGVSHTDGIYVPTTDFYVAWRSDGSREYYGFEVDQVTYADAPANLAAYASENDIPVNGIDSVFGKPEHINTRDIVNDVKTTHNYGTNERKIWHVNMAMQSEEGNYTNTTSSTDTTSVTFINVDITNRFSIPVKKEINGDVADGAERDFVFTLTPDEDTNPMPSTNTCTVTGVKTSSTCNIGEIAFTQAGTYGYTISESGDGSSDYSNYSFVGDRHITITAAIGASGALDVTWVDDTDTTSPTTSDAVTFVNTYTPKSVEYALSVKKTVRKLKTDSAPTLTYVYDITGIETDGEVPPMPSSTKITITGEGTANFDSVTYTKPGTYRYRIQEEETPDKLTTVSDYHEHVWAFDTSAHEVVVTVTDNAGQLEVSAYLDDDTNTTVQPLEIKNTYDPQDAMLELGITKAFTDNGQVRPDGKTFYFTLDAGTNDADVDTPMPIDAENGSKQVEVSLTDQGGNVLSAGSTIFGTIVYEKQGTYNYTIQETQGTDTGYTYDNTVYNVTVVVVHNNAIGHLVATATATKTGSSETINLTPGVDATYSTASTIANKVDFTNTYVPNPVDVTLPVTKTILGSDRPESKQNFTFTLTGKDETSTSMIQTGSATITDEGTSNDLKLHFTKAGTYTYTVSETVPNPIPTGYTYSDEEYEITVVVTDNNGQLSAVVTKKTKDGNAYTSDSLEFENAYAPTPTSAQFGVDKDITGHDRPDNRKNQTFTFEVTPITNNAPMPENVRITVTDDGNANFGAIEYHDAGIYKYKVTEIAGDVSGFTYDTTEHTVTVTVVDNAGVLSASVTVDDENKSTAKFTNEYAPDGTEISLPVTKMFSDESHERPEEQTFTFVIDGTNAASDATIPTDGNRKSITGTGTEYFALQFDTAGTYNYTVTESKPNPIPTGYTYDNTTFNVKVTVTDIGGALQASYEITNWFMNQDEVVFKNTYIPESTNVSLPVKKVIENEKLSEGDTVPEHTFRFDITAISENAPLPSTTYVEITGGGETNFGDIKFTKAGVYTYTIRENSTKENYENWGMDQKAYTVTVNVIDKDGQLVAEYSISDSDSEKVTLTNVYNPIDATLSIPVTKELSGNDRPSEYLKDFTFKLESVDGAPMPDDAVNGESYVNIRDHGDSAFGAITYEKTGKYYYRITEVNANETGYTYDDTMYIVEVTVVHDGNTDPTKQSLSASITSITNDAEDESEDEPEEDTVVFRNTYAPTPVEITLPVTKSVTGAETPTDKTFTFQLVGNDQQSRKTIAVGGLHAEIEGSGVNEEAFTMEFTAAGTYTYTVREVEGTDTGYTYDDSEYVVEVIVTDEDGTLKASRTVQKDELFVDDIAFENEYEPFSTTLALPVEKSISHNTSEMNDVFRFRITPRSNEPMPEGDGIVSIRGEAKSTFEEIEFTQTGHYYYTVNEINDGLETYTYDTREYLIHVEVIDDDGQLTAKWEIVSAWPDEDSSIEEEKDEILLFTNVYSKLDNPSTGDETHAPMWIFLMIGSLLMALASIITLRKNQKA